MPYYYHLGMEKCKIHGHTVECCIVVRHLPRLSCPNLIEKHSKINGNTQNGQKNESEIPVSILQSRYSLKVGTIYFLNIRIIKLIQ